MRIGVGLTAWRRPDYFDAVLERLRKNPECLDHPCFVSVDGGYPEHQEAMRKVFSRSGLPGEIELQSDNLGCAANTGLVFKTLFTQGMDAVIMLEDDTLPSVDFLHYMRSMLQRFASDENVFSVAASHRRVKTPLKPATHQDPDGWTMIDVSDALFPYTDTPSLGPGLPDAVFLRNRFSCHGWGVWRRVCQEIGDDWFGVRGRRGDLSANIGAMPDEAKSNPKGSWAVAMDKHWRKDRFEVAPDLSRVQNIGEVDGVFNPSRRWHRRNVRTDYWMDGEEGYRGAFRVIPTPSSRCET